MEDDYIKNLKDDLKRKLLEKPQKHSDEVLNSQRFKDSLKYLSDFSWDAIQTIRTISIYSTRANQIYDDFLSIKGSDDTLQSIIGIEGLIRNGVHNMGRRELRYLLEMSVKYLVVDQEQTGLSIKMRTIYLHERIPNSSIDVVERLSTPFEPAIDKEFKNEIKDIFYKACAYVHPSQMQIEERLIRYNQGTYLGFETANMLDGISKLTFRVYDIILTLLFTAFGPSMSGDLFIEIFDNDPEWKFHKSKYIKQYSKLFDYKSERQK